MVVGIGLGGIIGYKAVADGAPIDDLVLWSVRASGRTYIREQQAFAAVATGGQADARDAARPDGVVGLAGHRISSETVAATSEVDLAGIILPAADRRRVLLIGRDSGGVDKRLQDHIEQSGADVTVLQTDDYRLLVMVPDMEPDTLGNDGASCWHLVGRRLWSFGRPANATALGAADASRIAPGGREGGGSRGGAGSRGGRVRVTRCQDP